MYKKNKLSWAKHIDFIIIDFFVLEISFLLAFFIRHGSYAIFNKDYMNLAMVYALVEFFSIIAVDTMHNVMKRGFYIEFAKTIKHNSLVFMIVMVYMFTLKTSETYSRIVIFLTFVFHIVIGYLMRLLWKNVLIKIGMMGQNNATILLVLNNINASDIIRSFRENVMENYNIVGIVLDNTNDVDSVEGIPIVCKIDDAADYISREWIDEVYIDSIANNLKIELLMERCREMGVVIHYHVQGFSNNSGNQIIEKIGGTTVITTSISYATPLQIFIKRMMDVVGGIIGCVLALVSLIIVGPIIKLKSPGPIIYSQERIGKNGKRFKIYKIRSMYMNADERKTALLTENRVEDGLMFKMDFDPRIIGNVMLPDGTRRTGIGAFIRKYSIDEFPQFFNVLKGDMSLVGTRPPTVDEWEKYKYHHRARLACKPGITGMWQVSGRSDITDFEKVVELDTEYISNWSVGLDLRIIFKTFFVVIKKEGAM